MTSLNLGSGGEPRLLFGGLKVDKQGRIASANCFRSNMLRESRSQLSSVSTVQYLHCFNPSPSALMPYYSLRGFLSTQQSSDPCFPRFNKLSWSPGKTGTVISDNPLWRPSYLIQSSNRVGGTASRWAAGDSNLFGLYRYYRCVPICKSVNCLCLVELPQTDCLAFRSTPVRCPLC